MIVNKVLENKVYSLIRKMQQALCRNPFAHRRISSERRTSSIRQPQTFDRKHREQTDNAPKLSKVNVNTKQSIVSKGFTATS